MCEGRVWHARKKVHERQAAGGHLQVAACNQCEEKVLSFKNRFLWWWQ